MEVLIKATRYGNINFKLGEDGPTSKYIRPNNGSDSDKYPRIATDYIAAKEATNGEWDIAEDSVDKFYVYAREHKAELDEDTIGDWSNGNRYQLFRFIPNKDNRSNNWGLSLMCFQNLLVEWSSDIYLEDLTDDEALALKRYGPPQLRKAITAFQADDDEKQEALKEIETLEADINRFIKFFEDEIIEEVGMKDDPGRLDCGFVYIYPTNEPHKTNLRLASQLDHPKWLRVRMPGGQSTTVKRAMFDVFKRKFEKMSPVKLEARVVLD